MKENLENRKGAVMPLVAIILALFALGFMALVIDLGNVYIQRKKMITSADAAALAGAQVLRIDQKDKSKTESEIITEVEEAASKYAIDNGADPNQLKVYVGDKSVTLPNEKGDVEVRQIVEVTVGKNEPSIFARFLGSEYTDVKAHAIATWGYVYKSYIGAFPLFVFDINAENDDGKIDTNINVLLHDEYSESNNSYGLIETEQNGKNDIKAAIAGDGTVGLNINVGEDGTSYLSGEPGQADAIKKSVEERMQWAEEIQGTNPDQIKERRGRMIVLVPVIDHIKFLAIDTNNVKNAQTYTLPIKYFAYFEIKDIIMKNGVIGSNYALNPYDINQYWLKVDTPINYLEKGILKDKAEYSFIYGQFTGETVESAKVIVEPGDQTNPDEDGKAPATYVKLIE